MNPIEVDDEVLAYLKSKAEAFVDTPNTVLRRELLGQTSRPGRSPNLPRAGAHPRADTPGPSTPKLSMGMPEALRQILEVVALVRQTNRNRNEATVEVARRHGIARETVADKYGRQLELNTVAFDMLLSEPGLAGLQRKLSAKFPQHAREIAAVLEQLT